MRRRTFLAWIIGFAGLAFGWLALDGRRFQRRPNGPGVRSAPPPPADDLLGFFTPEEAVTMEAVLERMLPSNLQPGAPGARETRVLRYVDRQLREPHFERYQDLVRRGLEFLDQVAQGQGAVRFHQLTVEKQDELLNHVQRAEIRGHPFPGPLFFQIVLTISLEGQWGSPRYGGNHDKLAWRWVEIDPTCKGGLRACE